MQCINNSTTDFVRVHVLNTKVSILPKNVYISFTLLGFINPSLNPIIYAARYAVFKRFLKERIHPTNIIQVSAAT